MTIFLKDNENYVGDERIRELGGTPLSRDDDGNDNENGDNNDNDDNDDSLNTSLSNNENLLGIDQDGGYLHIVGEVKNGGVQIN